MTVRSSGNIIRLLLFLLILTGISGSVFSQTVINGNIKNIRGANKYPHISVTAITGANKMTVTDPAGFIVGDTVLVIQMKGVGIYTLPWGQWASQYGQPGLWEFIIISGVIGNEITFSNNLKVGYDIRGDIQIVNVPAFHNVTVGGASDLTCDPWDPVTKSGGVLALIVGNTLKLQKNIDVSGLGFKGGNGDFNGDGICQITDASYRQDAYPDSYTNAGWKGEGIANYNSTGGLLLPANAKGKGATFTGGGGGNGSYSGGGGGAHRGLGGIGGSERNICGTVFGGGTGGNKGEYNPDLLNRVFMGSGGGASTKSATGITGPGGNGGGIVIIIGNTIIGDGGHILANGGNGGNGGGTGPSGAAGGGAGGTIALSVVNYSGTFDANVEGGNGGNNPTPRLYGEGGGGGAGLVWLTTDNAGNINPKLNGGAAGTCDNPTASDGNSGEKRTAFNPNLNGFLFNSIRSIVTETRADTSCSNMVPPKLLGTLPVGGTAPFTVTWERSRDNFATSNVVATGAALWDYTPVPDDTLKRSGPIYFRRTITDSSLPTQLVDQSLPVVIEIQPSIKKYWVGPPDTVCFGQNSPTVGTLPSVVITGGNGITYNYIWMVSTDNTNFSAPANNNNASYSPPIGLTVPTWYRRTVTSGSCMDSTGIVKIMVLPGIGNNSITSTFAEEICDGSNFLPVTASVPSGGDGSYTYKWISSTTSWGAAPDIYNNQGYNPVAGSFPLGTTVSLRRVVFSGIHDVCKDTTSLATEVNLTRWPVIINNNIIAAQTIGYDTIPALLIENSTPGMTGGGGPGNYYYTWQKDTLSWAAAPGIFNLTTYQPPALKVTTTFRRYVTSPASSVCSSISNSITITVHAKITNSISLSTAANDTIATGTGPGQLTGSLPTGGSGIPGDYSYKWYRSTTGVFVSGDVIAGATSQSYDPGILTSVGSVTTFYFRRDVSSPIISPTSTYKSNIIKVVVLPVLSTYNINGSTPKCSGFRPDWLRGSTSVTGGDGKYKYTWQDSTSLHDFQDISGFVRCDSANYKPPVLTTGAAYRRIVYSTANNYTLQSATSNIVRVTIYQLPSGSVVNASPINVCDNGSPTAVPIRINLTPSVSSWTVVLNDSLGGSTSHTVTNPANPLIVNPTSTTSKKLRYEIYSVTDVHNCFSPASSFTGFQRVVVYRQPTADAGLDIAHNCGPTATLNASPAVGTGSWLSTFKKTSASPGPGSANITSPGNNVTDVTIGMNATAGFDFDTYRFYWTEVNGVCTGKDSVNITFDKNIPPVVFNPSGKATNNINKKETLPAYQVTVGKGNWEAPVTAGLDSITQNNTKVYLATNLVLGNNLYVYNVINGACNEQGQYLLIYQEIIVPEGISPNSDGVNDLFEIRGIDLDVNDFTLKIINSAGSEVFYTSNENWTIWDGKSDGRDLSEGTYYYLLTIQSKLDRNITDQRKGFVVLKRN